MPILRGKLAENSRKSTNFSAMSAILIFCFYLPYGFINQSLDTTPRFVIGVFRTGFLIQSFYNFQSTDFWASKSLLSPVNMSFGCAVIASWEARGVGVQVTIFDLVGIFFPFDWKSSHALFLSGTTFPTRSRLLTRLQWAKWWYCFWLIQFSTMHLRDTSIW